MPPHVTSSLEPHFNRARNVLSQRKSKRFGGWLDKVRVLPETQNLLPPPVNQSAADTIYASLLEDSQITAEYKKRGDDTPKNYKVIHPLGLVFRQRVIYLVASVRGYDTPIQFALHRFVSAKMIHKCYVPLYMSHFVSTYLRWDKLSKHMTMMMAIWLKSIKELPSVPSGLLP